MPEDHRVKGEALRNRFTRKYGHAPLGIWSAPGRVNLIGEHTDYNEGYVLPLAIAHSTLVAVGARSDRRVRVDSGPHGQAVTADLATLKPGSVQGWAAYPLGVAWALGQEIGLRNLTGMDLLFDSTVPIGAGLSSSAAIECATAVAVNDIAAANLDLSRLALIGQRAENLMVGAPTGIMDQTASLRGRAGSAVFLDCRSHTVEHVPLDLAGAGLTLLVMDTRVSHSHSDGGYASRRASCEEGAALLGVEALRDVSESDLHTAADVLNEETFRRVRHIVSENQRVLSTVELLRTTGPGSIGPVLTASHASMRDDFEISAPELNLAVETAMTAGALGARMTGGGFGGAAIALAPSDAAEEIRVRVTSAFSEAGYRRPILFEVTPGDGARRLL